MSCSEPLTSTHPMGAQMVPIEICISIDQHVTAIATLNMSVNSPASNTSGRSRMSSMARAISDNLYAFSVKVDHLTTNDIGEFKKYVCELVDQSNSARVDLKLSVNLY